MPNSARRASNVFATLQDLSDAGKVRLVEDVRKSFRSPSIRSRVIFVKTVDELDAEAKRLAGKPVVIVVTADPLLSRCVPGMKILDDAEGHVLSQKRIPSRGISRALRKGLHLACPNLRRIHTLLDFNAQGYGYDILIQAKQVLHSSDHDALLEAVNSVLLDQGDIEAIQGISNSQSYKMHAKRLIAFLRLSKATRGIKKKLLYQQVLDHVSF